jgi:hypothetical protein
MAHLVLTYGTVVLPFGLLKGGTQGRLDPYINGWTETITAGKEMTLGLSCGSLSSFRSYRYV